MYRLLALFFVLLMTVRVASAEDIKQQSEQEMNKTASEISEDDIISILGNQDPEVEVELKENIVVKEDKAVDNQLDKEIQNLNNSSSVESGTTDSSNYRDFATIRVLNKITTKSEEVKISKNKINQVGKLAITMAYCWQSPSSLESENKAYLEIFEQLDKNEQSKIFAGWLFSSSPAVSALQHPIYDVHLLSCNK
jgi:hypothetical protein